MHVVVLPLLSTANQFDPEVLPPLKDSAVWEARWQPLREQRGLFGLRKQQAYGLCPFFRQPRR
jgi:hypothetical protein